MEDLGLDCLTGRDLARDDARNSPRFVECWAHSAQVARIPGWEAGLVICGTVVECAGFHGLRSHYEEVGMK
jgi:hypothetical protein